jgi:hypothetical protein
VISFSELMEVCVVVVVVVVVVVEDEVFCAWCFGA